MYKLYGENGVANKKCRKPYRNMMADNNATITVNLASHFNFTIFQIAPKILSIALLIFLINS